MNYINASMLKEVFNELRIYPVIYKKDKATDNELLKAITVNENLKSLGYILKPQDIIKLAISNKLDKIYNDIKKYVGDVKAEPMYKNYPSQVMEIDEATFRFHQLCHYFSTYGVEELLGTTVDKGWVPEVENTKKDEDDVSLLSLKVFELVEDDKIATICIGKIVTKRERLTIPEKNIIQYMLPRYLEETPGRLNLDELENIKFKENLMDIFHCISFNEDIHNDFKFIILSRICKHTGDVLKCIDYCLTRERYHFKTTHKRLFVRILESYPVNDFKSNVIISNKRADRVKLIIKFLDFNEYSRSMEHKKVVNDLRNNKLKSWESRAKYLLGSNNADSLSYIGQHPGMMIRMVAWLLRLGYKVQDISAELYKNADKLSIQTLVTTLTYFYSDQALIKKNGEMRDVKEIDGLRSIFNTLLLTRLEYLDTKIKDKKVYLDSGNIDLFHSTIECNDKSSEGGYIRSGLAYRIPEDAKYIRFFAYWNNKNSRIDIDLHTCGLMHNNIVKIGYDAQYKATDDESIYCVTSGDMTCNNSAEYIDLALSNNAIEKASFNINSYPVNGVQVPFKDIDELFVGILAVDNIGIDVKLYNPKNCIYHHDLRSNTKTMNYGIIDVKNKYVKFIGKQTNDTYFNDFDKYESQFTALDYLKLLFLAQRVNIVNDKSEAEYIITVEKSIEENAISLIDCNFFMED